jgi:hypothetical protein
MLGLIQHAIYSLSNPRKLVRTNWPLTGIVASREAIYMKSVLIRGVAFGGITLGTLHVFYIQ